MERDAEGGHVILDPSISTHTLTWSVTIDTETGQADKAISTHTLTWSVTDSEGTLITYIENFNSHAHVERDSARCWIIS